jgi:ankyrin repeat protein
MQLLLSHGASVEARDITSKTPLLLAAYNGQCSAIELLLDWKANIKACDLQGNTALHHACQRKHDESALLLLERTDEVEVVNMTNRELRTPLHLSSRNGMVAVTRLLLEKGASVLAVDCNGMTPALACAPDPNVAECLAIILSMYPSVTLLTQQPNNFQKGLKKHPTLTQLLHLHPLSSIDYTGYNNVTSPEAKAASGDQSNLSHHSSDSDFY